MSNSKAILTWIFIILLAASGVFLIANYFKHAFDTPAPVEQPKPAVKKTVKKEVQKKEKPKETTLSYKVIQEQEAVGLNLTVQATVANQDQLNTLVKEIQTNYQAKGHDAIKVRVVDKESTFIARAFIAYNETGRTQTGVEEEEGYRAYLIDEATRKFEEYVLSMRNGAFIKSISLTNNHGEIIFYSTYEGFKANNPDTAVTKTQYNEKVGKNNEVEKTLVGEPVRLLNKFPTLDKVSILFPYEGKLYSTEVTRQELNAYLGIKIEKLSTKELQSSFIERVVNNDQKRPSFAKHFVKVK